MSKFISTLLILPLFLSAQVNYQRLNLRDILVIQGKGDTIRVPEASFTLLKNASLDDVQMLSISGYKILATFHISPDYSRRSAIKAGSVKLLVKYRLITGDDHFSRRSEYIFYLDQDKTFKVKEQFVIRNGLHPMSVKLMYSGVLEDQ